jgi:hypothetical protein
VIIAISFLRGHFGNCSVFLGACPESDIIPRDSSECVG